MDPLKVVHMLPVIWESLGLLSQWLFIHRRSKKSCRVTILKKMQKEVQEKGPVVCSYRHSAEAGLLQHWELF